MYRTRIYWISILGIGVLSLMWSGSNVFTAGSEIAGIAELVGGVGITAGALYSLTYRKETSKPTNQPIFWLAVLGFALLFAGTLLQFV